jgi:copper oxidase (laccase) domain-containing protein
MTLNSWGISDVIPGTISGVTYKGIVYPDDIHTYIGHSPVIKMTQTHSATCRHVTQKTLKTGYQLPDCDACFTTMKGIVLSVKTADCLPILIHHPTGLAAGIHAGRKGTENHILSATLTMIKQVTGLCAGFTVYFGPAISKANYQIDKEANLYFDLVTENISQLNKAIPSQGYTLIQSKICTFEDPRFDSYRQNGQAAGRFWTFIKT